MTKQTKYTNVLSFLFSLSLAAFLLTAPTACGRVAAQDDQTHEEIMTEPTADVVEAAAYIESLDFKEPTVRALASSSVRTDYSYLDPQKIVPAKLLASAVAYYQANLSKIANKKYLSVVDFSAYSGKPRFFVIDMASGAVTTFHVAHGSGSDSNNDGYAEKFSNAPGSNASSLGYYLTAETYSGKHGLSLRLDGLSSTNSNVRSRAVVIHGADYVHGTDIKAGRSWGCLAVAMVSRDKVVGMLKGGSLIYAGLSK